MIDTNLIMHEKQYESIFGEKARECMFIPSKYDYVITAWCNKCLDITLHVGDLGQKSRCKICEDGR